MKNLSDLKKSTLCLSMVAALCACEDEKIKVVEVEKQVVVEVPATPETPVDPAPEDVVYQPFKVGVLPDTQGGTSADGQSHALLHPMDEVLKHLKSSGVQLVLAVGDFSDGTSAAEHAEWRSVADAYLAERIEFSPILGNHETSWSSAYDWDENMKDYTPQDAVHLPGYEWSNYYVIRENVLIFGLTYYGLPHAFEWIKDVVLTTQDHIDHIIVSGHVGLIGAKYG